MGNALREFFATQHTRKKERGLFAMHCGCGIENKGTQLRITNMKTFPILQCNREDTTIKTVLMKLLLLKYD